MSSTTLAEGTPVTLELNVDLSGAMGSKLAGTSSGQAAVGVVEGSTVQRPGYGEPEWEQPQMASFTAAWNLYFVGGYGMHWSVGWQTGRLDSFGPNRYGLRGASSYVGLHGGGAPDCVYVYDQNGLSPGGMPLPTSVRPDAAPTQSFTAFVGQTYTLYQHLSVDGSEALEWNGQRAGASVDFAHTLGAAVLSDEPGVSLTWDVPLAAVPEPSSGLLALAGLGAIAAAAGSQRRRQRQRLASGG